MVVRFYPNSLVQTVQNLIKNKLVFLLNLHKIIFLDI